MAARNKKMNRLQRRTSDAKGRLLENITSEAKSRRRGKGLVRIADFIAQYYRGVSTEDLRERRIADLSGAALSHLDLATKRKKGQIEVRVFNPDPERDGWSSSHTVLQAVTDDRAFLVDSLAAAVNNENLSVHLTVHPVLRVQRDADGTIKRVLASDETSASVHKESLIQIEFDRVTDRAFLKDLQKRLKAVLRDVKVANDDWQAMRGKAIEISEWLSANPPKGIARADVDEACAMLDWMADDNFTFLGYREYTLSHGDEQTTLDALPRTGLGILRRRQHATPPRDNPTLDRAIRRQARSTDVLIITKANSRSTVHRPAHLDYIGVKTFDEDGRASGEKRFLGLFTSIAYSRSPRDIPILRHKVEKVMQRSGLAASSHGGKALMHILEHYPRDELLQSSIEDLARISEGIASLQERQRIKLFLRRDAFRRFFSCMVFVPREKYNTQVRQRIEQILLDGLDGVSVESEVKLSDSNLARLHSIVRTRRDATGKVNVASIERQIVEAVRTWRDGLREQLVRRLGEEDGLRLFHRYGKVFPAAYEEDVSPREATFDVERIDQLDTTPDSLMMSLYRPPTFPPEHVRFKVFRRHNPIPLSDALPMLENLGLTVISERPYHVHLEDGTSVWVQDFEMRSELGSALDPAKVNELFQETFANAWRGHTDSDDFNRLALRAQIPWRYIMLLRGYCRYLLQTGLPYSQTYMEEVAVGNHEIVKALIDEFALRFDPTVSERRRSRRLPEATKRADELVEAVASADEDRILRGFVATMRATLRTNFYQTLDGVPKPYISYKFNPRRIPNLPRPLPAFEVFVYSPRMEGVHLRGGPVARGGIRWSDRREDFRTEVLGLMKAQKVKNTLIVPTGAKGGFVCKRLPDTGREAVQAEVVFCYSQFIRGLLDITDNRDGDAIVPPPDTVRYDKDDPYLVVAADKGTATFSDTANALAAEYGFWLGDAFASGGSVGYDHKGMGITAKGAWEAVKRHFREIGVDVQSEPFTVCGIGDMGGDVFGNGLLRSRTTRLIAAFNHLHIFLDPDPDPETSYAERERLFNLPRSSWTDYDASLISTGGGVFSRQDKRIPVSPQVRKALGIDDKSKTLTPTALIRAILRAPVDLLWNGGIGTYVKSRSESHDDAGDRANDAVRVDGADLRCKVIGEGGNLGLTQLGRVEYARHDGRINTDFIDNAGGVNCSDREVNIKILLSLPVLDGTLSGKRRNRLLARMTDEVEQLVLRDNYLQTQAISVAETDAAARAIEHGHLIRELETGGDLDRDLEYLPGSEEIRERHAAGRGLTRPELSVLLSYSKINLFDQLARSDVADDAHLVGELANYFPAPLRKSFRPYMKNHALAREIVATQITNSLINRMGPTFMRRTQAETGASAQDVARAFTVVRETFDMRGIWHGIERLDNVVQASAQYSMMAQTTRLLRRAAVWVLTRAPGKIDIAQWVARFAPGVELLAKKMPVLLRGEELQRFEEAADLYTQMEVPRRLANRLAGLRSLYAGLDIVDLALELGRDEIDIAQAYFELGDALSLGWIRDQAERLKVTGRWHAMARGSLRDSVDDLQRSVTAMVMRDTGAEPPHKLVEDWLTRNAAGVTRARRVVEEIQSLGQSDFATLSVAISESRKLGALGGEG